MNDRSTLHTIVAAAVLSVGLANCGGGDGNGNQNNNQNPGNVDYSKIEQSPLAEGALIEATDEQLAQHLTNGMRLNMVPNGAIRTNDLVFGGVPESAQPQPTNSNGQTTDSTGDKSSGGSGSGNFSETNVHVAGVDEADYAKYDGKHWFISTTPEYSRFRDNQPALRIFATDPSAPNAEVVANYKMGEKWGPVSEMYLVQKEEGVTSSVATLRSQWGNVRPLLEPMIRPAIAIDAIWPGPINSTVKVELIDVTDPENPDATWKMEIDGSLVNSRKIDNTLYLITRYEPWLHDLRVTHLGGENKENEDKLNNAAVNKLLPEYSIDDKAKQLLSRKCFIQQNLKSYHGFSSLVSVTAIDLAERKVVDSKCLNANVHGLYMSQKSLYLGGTDYTADFLGGQGRTALHKFSLTPEGLKYRASGSVKGTLGWSDPSFFMDELNDKLRIVTTAWNQGRRIEHMLSTLAESQDKRGELELVAQIPSKERPEPIGKPNEQIFSVRFMGERAYIVTFLRIDPLYVIDLSDELDPKIAGELEIPGFATYLHPINDDVLFSVGNQADEQGRAQGVKLELFDVSDITDPKVVATEVIGDAHSHSEALHNLRAMSFLQASEDQLRVTLPVNVFKNPNPEENFWRSTWSHTGLYLYEINGLMSGELSLDSSGYIEAESASDKVKYPQHGGVDRGVMHDEAVFYTHGNAVWAAFWNDPKNAVGPIKYEEPLICPTVIVPSISVDVYSSNRNVDMGCTATVTATSNGETYELEGVARKVNDEVIEVPVVDNAATEPFNGDAVSMGGNGVTVSRPISIGRYQCTYTGPDEVAGDFEVKVEMPEHETQYFKTRVNANECNVDTRFHSVTLVHESEPVFCTQELRPSFGITVEIDPDADVSACDAEVVVSDQEEKFALMPNEFSDRKNACSFSGVVYERAGIFDLSISLDGFVPVSVSEIEVTKDECHVHTFRETFKLEPAN